MKILAFDVFNTVFDMSTIDRKEIVEYARHISKKVWEPLILPESWLNLKAHPDAKEGLERLRKKFYLVTFSNGPLELLLPLSFKNGLYWDDYIHVAISKMYKPNKLIYPWACGYLGENPANIGMVTANKDFGDLEGANACGMIPLLIRNDKFPKDLIELAQFLEC
jgi:FMN phosphatase YigB (HAD superfamily)